MAMKIPSKKEIGLGFEKNANKTEDESDKVERLVTETEETNVSHIADDIANSYKSGLRDIIKVIVEY